MYLCMHVHILPCLDLFFKNDVIVDDCNQMTISNSSIIFL
jgi:hypothetical protein